MIYHSTDIIHGEAMRVGCCEMTDKIDKQTDTQTTHEQLIGRLTKFRSI